MPRRTARVALLVAFGACTGTIDGASGGGGPPSGDPAAAPERGARAAGVGGGGGAGAGTAPAPLAPAGAGGARAAGEDGAGPLPLRRLTRDELNNTVRDLLGDTSAPANAFPEEGLDASGFAMAGLVSPVEARRIVEATESLAAAAVRNLGALLGCNPQGAAETACVKTFIETFGRRAWRRPLEAGEVSDLQRFFAAARAGRELPEAAALLLQALLQSPKFLYVWPVAPGARTVREGALVKLGPYEVASRLSYFLWGSMPDEALFAAAAAGQLSTPDEVAAQARRLLADRKSEAAVDSFHRQWLGLGGMSELRKDTAVYPAWNATMRTSMEAETRALARRVVLAGDGRLETLLLTPLGLVNEALAKVYGLAERLRGPDLVERQLDPVQRPGVLTRGAFLAVHGAEGGSHPIRRGLVVWERLVCGEIPPPPMNVPTPRPTSPNLSTRERFAEHSKNECAAGCHGLLDPAGFAFETYDGIGAWRATDGGKPVDASGTLPLPLAGPQGFTGARQMLERLAASEDARRCLVLQWARFALARREVPAEAASLGAAYEAFARAGFDLRALLAALARTRTFLYRAPAAGEVL